MRRIKVEIVGAMGVPGPGAVRRTDDEIGRIGRIAGVADHPRMKSFGSRREVSLGAMLHRRFVGRISGDASLHWRTEVIIRFAALHRPGENAVCNEAFDVFRMIRMAIVASRPAGRGAEGVGVKDGVRQRDEQKGNDKNDIVRHLPEKAPGRRIKSINWPDTNWKRMRTATATHSAE